LLDLWLLTNEVGIDTRLACQAFSTYRPINFTSVKAIENLEKKLMDSKFLTDISNLISVYDNEYCVEDAAALIIEKYLSLL